MKLTTTFNLLKLAGACGQEVGCGEGYDKLSQFLGGTSIYGKDTEINILTILESNGLDDAVWALEATKEESDKTRCLIACDFAESVLHIFESKRPNDDRPRKAIEAARKFANGEISESELIIPRRNSNVAAFAYGDAAAFSAAYAASNASYSAASYAAEALKNSGTEKLTAILKSHLQG